MEYLTSGAVLVVVALLLQELELCSGTFLFFFSILLFWLCASVGPFGFGVVAEAGCNWYLHDINIYSLSKKNQFNNVFQFYSTALFSGIFLFFVL